LAGNGGERRYEVANFNRLFGIQRDDNMSLPIPHQHVIRAGSLFIIDPFGEASLFCNSLGIFLAHWVTKD
jgi:hypothetical protein